MTTPSPVLHTLPPDVRLEVFADYNTIFVLADGALPPPPGDGTVEEVLADQVATRTGVLCIGTARRMPVPLTVRLADSVPDDDLAEWDHVTQAEITTTTGALRIMGVTDDEPQSQHLRLPPGTYRVRVYAGGLDTVSADGLDGDDHYQITLWPKVTMPPRVIKRCREPFQRG